MKSRILLLEDMPDIAMYYGDILSQDGYDIRIAHNSQEFFPAFGSFSPDLILLDIQLKGSEMNGIEVFRALKERPNFRTEVMVLSSQATRSEVAEAMKLGACNFHEKGGESFSRNKFLADVRQAIDVHRQKTRVHELRLRQLDNPLVGSSKVMQEVKEKILRFSESDINLLIIGETGTGKGVAAKLLHDLSDKREKPYKVVNIQSVPETLVESELFGRKKGAFTGATSSLMGYFERADGGTLFIDEISSLSPANQVKILTVIEDGNIPVLGAGGDYKPVDVRIVSATNGDLPALIAEGGFRKDLYFRLAIGVIHMPALRERGNDVLELLEHFLILETQERNLSLDYDAQAVAEPLLSYEWPGNVREVRNLAKRIAALHKEVDNDAILAEFTAFREQHEMMFAGSNYGDDSSEAILECGNYHEAKDEFERRYLEHHLRKANGQVPVAAERIGIERTNFYKKMKKHGVKES